MSLQLLAESFVFGNLDICFTNQIRNDIIECLDGIIGLLENNFPEDDEGLPWRLMQNLSFIVESCENWIIGKKEKFSKLIDFLEKVILITTKKFQITDLRIPENLSKSRDYLVINFKVLLNRLYGKLNLYKISDVSVKIDPFIGKFSNFLDEDGIYYDNVTPYDDVKWTSKWKLVTKNKEIIIEDVDVYLDSYFKNSNFYYNKTMFKNIKKTTERLLYLKEKSPNYYRILTTNIKDVTKTMYDTFPLKLVFREYKSLIDIDDRVYKKTSFDHKDESMWLLSIVPKFLSSYILGFPVVSFDIPGDGELGKSIKMISEKGEEHYFDFISKEYNIPNIKSREFNIKTGNPQDENGEVLDLCYCKISDYNQDDVVTLYNNGVVHHFSCREFESILRKQENPYNRQKYPNFVKIIENMKFKKKITKSLLLRGLNLDLNGTMLENFTELKEKISEDHGTRDYPIVFHDTDVVYRPLIDMFLNSLY